MTRIRSIEEARAHLKDWLENRSPAVAHPAYVWSYGDPARDTSSHAFLVRRRNAGDPAHSTRTVYLVGPRGGIHAAFSLADWQYAALLTASDTTETTEGGIREYA